MLCYYIQSIEICPEIALVLRISVHSCLRWYGTRLDIESSKPQPIAVFFRNSMHFIPEWVAREYLPSAISLMVHH